MRRLDTITGGADRLRVGSVARRPRRRAPEPDARHRADPVRAIARAVDELPPPRLPRRCSPRRWPRPSSRPSSPPASPSTSACTCSRHDLRRVPDPSAAGARLRRGRDRDMPAVLEVDGLAFDRVLALRRHRPGRRPHGHAPRPLPRRRPSAATSSATTSPGGPAPSATSSASPCTPTATAAASAPRWSATRSTGADRKGCRSVLVNTQEDNRRALAPLRAPRVPARAHGPRRARAPPRRRTGGVSRRTRADASRPSRLLAVAAGRAADRRPGGGRSRPRRRPDRAAPPSPHARACVRQTDWVGPDAVFQVASQRRRACPRAPPSAPSSTTNVAHPGRPRRRRRRRGARSARIFRRRPTTGRRADRSRRSTIVSACRSAPARPRPSTGSSSPRPGVYPFAVQVLDAEGERDRRQLVTTMLRLGPPDEAVRLQQPSPSGWSSRCRPPVPGARRLPHPRRRRAPTSLITTIDAVALRIRRAPHRRPRHPSRSQLLAQPRRRRRGRRRRAAAARVGRQLLADPYAPIDTRRLGAAGCSATRWATSTPPAPPTLQGLLRHRPRRRPAVLDRTVTPAALDRPARLGVEAVAVPSDQLAPLASATATSTFADAVRASTRRRRAATLRAVVADDVTAARLTQGDDPVLAGHRALAELALLHLAAHDLRRGRRRRRARRAPTPPPWPPSSTGSPTHGHQRRRRRRRRRHGQPGDPRRPLPGPPRPPTAPGEPHRARSCAATRPTRPPTSAATPADLRARPVSPSTASAPSFPAPDESPSRSPAPLWSSGDRTPRRRRPRRHARLGRTRRSPRVTDEIVVAPEQVVTLTSSSGEVPLNLENRLPYDGQRPHRAHQRQARLPRGLGDRTDPPQPPRPPPSSSRSRSGPRAPSRSPSTSPRPTAPSRSPPPRYTVRSTAISGIGLVLSIGAGLFLLVWWAQALPHLPPRPQAGGLEPSGPLGRRAGWLRSARQRPRPPGAGPPPDHWRADEPRPHRHRQLVRPDPRRDRRPAASASCR